MSGRRWNWSLCGWGARGNREESRASEDHGVCVWECAGDLCELVKRASTNVFEREGKLPDCGNGGGYGEWEAARADGSHDCVDRREESARDVCSGDGRRRIQRAGLSWRRLCRGGIG